MKICMLCSYTFRTHLYTYVCNHSLDIQFMNFYLTVCQRVRSTSQIILLYFLKGRWVTDGKGLTL